MKRRYATANPPAWGAIIKLIVLLVAVCLLLGICARSCSYESATGLLSGANINDETAIKLFAFTFGLPSSDDPDLLTAAILFESPSLRPAYETYMQGTAEAESPPSEDNTADADTTPASSIQEAPEEIDENPDDTQDNPVPDRVETTITGENSSGYLSADGIVIKNKSAYDIDIEKLLNSEIQFKLDLDEPQVLIIHTHGSEAYTPDGDDVYTESDPSRTEDKNFSVIRVGDELAETFESRGIKVIHDRDLYDYPSYTGSYTRSLAAIENYLKEYPDIKIVIDLHRDALIGNDGTVYKTVANINGETCSQVLLIVGTDSSGLTHPNWRQNMSLALRLQASMAEKYPKLARPLTVSEYRYNQQATTGSMILEVGCNGNTLQEALSAVRYFGDAAADVLLTLADTEIG
ncbi:MAG: stage II sporulation protein P [Oscillospiraceae bacterium]